MLFAKIKTVSILLLLLPLPLVFGSCKTQQHAKVMNQLNGSWSGDAYQFDIEEEWSINFTADMAKGTYSINYPSLGCAATLTLIQHRNDVFEFRETLHKGLNVCTNQGKVTLKLNNNNTLDFAYCWPNDTHLNATGILKKD